MTFVNLPVTSHNVSHFPGGGRGRRRKVIPKSLPVISPCSGTDAPSSNDLGNPLSDEEEPSPTSHSPMMTFNPVPEMVLNRPTDTQPVVKPEPADDVGDSTYDGGIPGMFQLMEHSYSSMEHISLPPNTDRYWTVPQVEEEPLSRTTGRKCAGSDWSTRCDDDSAGVDVVVWLPKKRAPPITNRLIIPVLRVARSALRDLSEDAVNEVYVTPNNSGRRATSNGELPCCVTSVFENTYFMFFFRFPKT